MTSSSTAASTSKHTLDSFVVKQKPWLDRLNSAQTEAVTWKAQGGLQILAGPGSGKTRVLTCRVAYLIKECGIKPEDLIVVTFTNKAANEMKHRLQTLLGENLASRINMGTFHSVAVRYLRKYGKVVSLQSNFVIADMSDCQAILKPLVKEANEVLKVRSREKGQSYGGDDIKVKVVQEIISKSKAKGISEEAYLMQARESESVWKETVADIYIEYQKTLRSTNTVDFDDLLVFCERMLGRNPNATRNIQHVLVDEFQDTNTIQYEIVKLMAKSSGSLTIVGDPDQSIYAWRSAEIENISYMSADFPGTHKVFLEDNYRSTGSILQAALAVVEQDQERIKKSLRTSHPTGSPVVLRGFQNPQEEAGYIAYEIKRTIAHSGGQLEFKDFAILLRYNALSRAIEEALQQQSIPCRMIGGQKFFERAEVKDILSYLQLAENPAYNPAFNRVVNVPKRAIGDKTTKDISLAAKQKNLSCFVVVDKALKGSSIGGLKPAQKKKLKEFAKTILKVRERAKKGASVADLIDFIVEDINYKDHLERTYGAEQTTRLENINELKAYADQVAKDHPLNSSDDALLELEESKEVGEDDGVIDLVSDDEADDDGSDPDDGTPLSGDDSLGPLAPQDANNPLRTFLAASMLSTDTETQDAKEDSNTSKVIISTCHAAKGLEWPVVFLPAAETGVYPAFRKSDPVEVAEERRLLYVAMTRAQALLHITHTGSRMERGITEEKSVTEFLTPVVRSKAVPFAREVSAFDEEARANITAVTGRAAVKEEIAKLMMETFDAAHKAPPVDSTVSHDGFIRVGRPENNGGYTLGGSPSAYPGFQGVSSYRSNSGTGNKYSGAFATSTGSTPSFSYHSGPRTQASGGFYNVASVKNSNSRWGEHPAKAASGADASFRSARNAFTTASINSTSALLGSGSGDPSMSASNGGYKPSFRGSAALGSSSNLFKPFKPPSMAKGDLTNDTAQQVSAVETRLTQQSRAVMLKPMAPTRPSSKPEAHLSFSNRNQDDTFSYLKGLAKEEMDDIAPSLPKSRPVSSQKRSNSDTKPQNAAKRNKSNLFSS